MTCPRFDIRSDSGNLLLRNDWDPSALFPIWWSWTEITGWFDVPIRADRIDLAGANGELVANKRTAQPIVVDGFVGAARPEDVWLGPKRLRTIGRAMVAATGTLVWHSPVDEQLTVKLAPAPFGEVRIGKLTDKGFDAAEGVVMGFRWRMSFLAPTPGPTAYP